MVGRKMKLFAVAGLALMLTFVLAGGVVAAKVGGGGPARLIVTFDGPAVSQAAKDYVEDKGGQVLNTFDIVPGMVVLLPSDQVQGLRGIKGVREVGPDGRVYAIDAELDDSWGVKRIGAGTVHGYNLGSGIKLGIIDSGIDYTHTDLNDNYAGGHDFVNDDADPWDDNGHGTHVAGIAAAEDNDIGVVGVAPGASIHALKVLDAGGGGYWSNIIRALEWSVNNGIQVANMSFGAGRDAPGVHDAFRAAYKAGIVLVASAGNSGNPKGKGNSIGYPARYEEVIAVGATDQSDTRASFSSTGDQLELAAPGVDINSTLLGGSYGEKSGTSMASPHVAGTAALVIASGVVSDTDGVYGIANEVRDRMNATAFDLGDAGKDSQYGYGLVDADEAAPSGPVNDPPTVSITSPADGSTFDSGATILFEGTASDSEDGDLTASLVWTSDIDGAIGTGASFSTTLSDGSHTITASVTDSGGKTGSDSISITVGTPTEPTAVSVTSIDYTTEGGRNSDKHLNITIALVDDLDNPVAGASVSIRLDNTTTGQSWTGAATTGTDGTVTFSLKNAPSGTYTTTVTDVDAAGWDGITPPNGFTK